MLMIGCAARVLRGGAKQGVGSPPKNIIKHILGILAHVPTERENNQQPTTDTKKGNKFIVLISFVSS